MKYKFIDDALDDFMREWDLIEVPKFLHEWSYFLYDKGLILQMSERYANERVLNILSRLEYELRQTKDTPNLKVVRDIIEELGGITDFYNGQ